jgi:protein phosphatase
MTSSNDHATHLNNDTHGDDAITVSPPLYAVMDGVTMGDGSYASNHVQRLFDDDTPTTVDGVTRIFAEANNTLYGHRDGGSLTTATAIVVDDDTLHVVYAGDSPAYRIREGTIEKLTTEHTAPGSTTALTNAIGIGPDYHTAVESTEYKPHDIIVLATDGVSDNVTQKELVDSIGTTANKTLKAITALLQAKQAADTGHVYDEFKPDDQACIVVQ